jgi:DNA-binding LacI/PurR family transcriptional regulator
MRFCKKFHIQFPDEIGLSGFSNLDSMDMLWPSLTKIKQPALFMGKIATELLIKRSNQSGRSSMKINCCPLN